MSSKRKHAWQGGCQAQLCSAEQRLAPYWQLSAQPLVMCCGKWLIWQPGVY